MSRSALPPWYSKQSLILAQDFDTLADFTLGGSPTVAEISTDYVTQGSGSLKMTASGSAATADFALPAGTKFGPQNPLCLQLRVFIPAGASAPSSVLIYLTTNAGFGAGTWASATVNQYEGVTDQATLKTGWNNLLITRANFAGGTPTVLDNPSNVFVVARVRLEANKGPAYFDGMWLNARTRPKALLWFDDLHGTLFTTDAAYGGLSAAAYVNAKGLVANVGFLSPQLDQTDYLTTAQCDTLYGYGWDFCNHCNTSTAFTSLTESQIEAALNGCAAVLKANGWTRGNDHAVYPSGEYTVGGSTARLLSGMGFKTARSIQATLINRQIDPDNLFNLWAKGVGNASGITIANITSKIAETFAAGGMAGMYAHALGATATDYYWAHANMAGVIDWLAARQNAGQLDVVTISEWYAGLSGARINASTGRIAA